MLLMQSSLNTRIKETKLTSVNVNIPRNISNNLKLKGEWNTELYIPEEKENNTLLFVVELSLTEENEENFEIKLKADIIFEFDEIPQDYKSVGDERCMPLAQNKLSEMLDNILEISGYTKLNLAGQMDFYE